ncbi:hypothetical protein [Halovenus aranensis]|uniref:hypothetical protein n=1 Tax=Halovenus aranensis TaxID=890420 RepID=UPI0011798E8A|nr:hypothetical protein [Halovenus aranensis]
MSGALRQQNNQGETDFPTKRVFMRAEHGDSLLIIEKINTFQDMDIPERVSVVQRDLTYYGPKLRVEETSENKQYIITAPGPESQAMMWKYCGQDTQKIAEATLKFEETAPQYDICPHCNEPLSTVAHRRRSVVGACE